MFFVPVWFPYGINFVYSADMFRINKSPIPYQLDHQSKIRYFELMRGGIKDLTIERLAQQFAAYILPGRARCWVQGTRTVECPFIMASYLDLSII
jgi:hypothetical protein